MTYEFGSAEWLAIMHATIAERARALIAAGEPANFSMCELFRDAPEHLSPNGQPIVWSCIVSDGHVDFQLCERTDVQIHVDASYPACADLARYDTKDDPDRASFLRISMDKLREKGELKLTLSEEYPNTMGSMHDAVARLTQ
ncbi:MAG: hypothetical protein RJS97_22960 [Parvibaculaceae bacterium]